MILKLLRYPIAGVAAVVLYRLGGGLTDVDVLAEAAQDSRTTAYQTLAGMAVAVMAIQVAGVAYFMTSDYRARLGRVMAVSNGAVATSLALDAVAAGVAGPVFASFVILDRGGDTIIHDVAVGLLGILALVVVDVGSTMYRVLVAVERDARDEVAHRREESAKDLLG